MKKERDKKFVYEIESEAEEKRHSEIDRENTETDRKRKNFED